MVAQSDIMIHYPRAVACFIYQRAKEFKKNSSARRTQHDPLAYGCGMFIYPSARGRVKGWWHHDEPSHNYKMAGKSAIMIQYPPSHNYKMAAKSAIMIHCPRAAAWFMYLRAKEFKKNSSSRRTQHDPLA